MIRLRVAGWGLQVGGYWFVTLSVISLVIPGIVSAHTLKTDGPIGAVLHVDPEDDPVAGQPAAFFFEFTDRSGKFQPAKCTCEAVISQDGQELYRQPLFTSGIQASLTSPSFSFTFPDRDIYQVGVLGQATDDSFPGFQLNFDVRVARDSQAASGSDWPLALHHTVFLICGLLLIVGIVIDLVRRRLMPKTGPKLVACLAAGLLLGGPLLSIPAPPSEHHSHHRSTGHHQMADHACCLPLLAAETVDLDPSSMVWPGYFMAIIEVDWPAVPLTSISPRSPPLASSQYT